MTTMTERLTLFAQLQAMADDARPQGEADWDSDRQVGAENKFFQKVEAHLPPPAFAALADYCLKATSEERIDEAMRIISEHLSDEASAQGGRG